MRLACFIVAAVWLASCVPGAAPDVAADPLFGARQEIALKELAWTAPDANRVDLLLEDPAECLRQPINAAGAYLVEVGRAAFSSPLLFGGEAARSGLSCQSCHRSGHDNDAFFLRGLSGEPGTADVTSSLFSKTREDGRFNPVPIPTLVGIVRKEAFGTVKPAPSLHDFIEGAVREEFQGAAATETVIKGLGAYVAHLDEAACAEMRTARTAKRDMAEAARVVHAARAAYARNDQATADFLIVSARQALGRVHERFPTHDFDREREILVALSERLNVVRRAQDRQGVLLHDLAREIERAGLLLDDSSAGSFYDQRVLEASIAAR